MLGGVLTFLKERNIIIMAQVSEIVAPQYCGEESPDTPCLSFKSREVGSG